VWRRGGGGARRGYVGMEVAARDEGVAAWRWRREMRVWWRGGGGVEVVRDESVAAWDESETTTRRGVLSVARPGVQDTDGRQDPDEIEQMRELFAVRDAGSVRRRIARYAHFCWPS
jgi:hypothetical protein